MIVRTPEDLINAAFSVIDKKIDARSIEISDDFVIKIKIRDDEWDDPSKLDYRIANIIIKLQSDILGFYNATAEEKVTLKSIDSNPYLIVKVEINEGCTEIIAFVKGLIDRIFTGMNSKEKIIALGIILGIVATGGAAWVGVDYISYLKEVKIAEIEEKNRSRAIEALEATQIALINNRRTPEYIAANIKTGTLQIGSENPLTGKELKDIKKDEAQSKEFSYNVDGVYSVIAYDFKALQAKLEGGPVSFKASVEHLDDAARGELSRIAERAIGTNTVQRAPLQVTATIQDGEIKHAAIIGIGDKRANVKELVEVLKDSRTPGDKPKMIQGLLFP